MRVIRSHFISFVLIALLAGYASAAPGDPPTWRDSTWDYRSEDSTDIAAEVSVPKTVGVASMTLIAYGAAYWLVFHKGWWDDGRGHFRFENDFDYAMNLDKFGHFLGGVFLFRIVQN